MTQTGREKGLEGLLAARAAAFPGQASSPYVPDVRKELARVCDWLVREQNPEGLWPQGEVNLRFYSDAYAVRALMAASGILGDERCLSAAEKWLRYILALQRPDGGWWVGYGKGDHDYDDPECDRSVVYIADAGEVTTALVDAYHLLAGRAEGRSLAGDIREGLLRFRNFADQFRLSSGAMGLGYTRRDFYDPEGRDRTFMQSHCMPYHFASVVTGAGFNAGLYTITGDAADWRKAVQSLDWCLEHMAPSSGKTLMYNDPGVADIISLHRITDWLYDCSTSPRGESEKPCGTPEPRFRDRERQKLYGLWKWLMHLVADRQDERGEWPVFQGGRQVIAYDSNLRHRMFFVYSLTGYLARLGERAGEDERLSLARDRQMWLCAEPRILSEHYGVCVPGAHVMPTGLWGMTLAEMLRPMVTLPSGMRAAASVRVGKAGKGRRRKGSRRG